MINKVVNGEVIPLTPEELAEFNTRPRVEDLRYWGLDYNKKRALNYPSIQDQLDMLWRAMDAGEIPKATEWFNQIQAVKQQFPKPVETNVSKT